MTYVSVDDMMDDAWVSREAVALQLLVAIANIRSKLAEGIPMVTRERTTYSKYVVPPPSSYVRYRESLPMLPDPVLQDYLKENLTFSENKAFAKEWHNKSIRQGNMPRVAHQRIVGHVDGLDITESCLLEREETSCVVAEEP